MGLGPNKMTADCIQRDIFLTLWHFCFPLSITRALSPKVMNMLVNRLIAACKLRSQVLHWPDPILPCSLFSLQRPCLLFLPTCSPASRFPFSFLSLFVPSHCFLTTTLRILKAAIWLALCSLVDPFQQENKLLSFCLQHNGLSLCRRTQAHA